MFHVHAFLFNAVLGDAWRDSGEVCPSHTVVLDRVLSVAVSVPSCTIVGSRVEVVADVDSL